MSTNFDKWKESQEEDFKLITGTKKKSKNGKRKMKKYSWYTIPVKLTDLSTVYRYAVDRFIPLEVDCHGFGSYIHVKAETFVTPRRRLAALQAQYERRTPTQPHIQRMQPDSVSLENWSKDLHREQTRTA